MGIDTFFKEYIISCQHSWQNLCSC